MYNIKQLDDYKLGWAKCWSSGCEKSISLLIKLPNAAGFNRVWFCLEHGELQKKINNGTVIAQVADRKRDGHLTWIKDEQKPSLNREQSE